MTTGQRIKEARKKAGLTQKELGQRLGVTYQTLAQWENDHRNPKPETLERIAEALGVLMFELVGDHPQKESFLYGYFAADQETRHIARIFKYSFSPLERELIKVFARLNDTGQQEAVKRLGELLEIPRYQRREPPKEPQDPSSESGVTE